MRKVKIPEKEYIELIQIKARTESFIDYVKRSRLIEGIASECKDLGIETMTPDQINDMMRLYEQHIT